MKTLFNTIGFILVLILLITFAVENNTPIDLSYLGLKIAGKAYMLVLISFFLGVVCGNILDVVKRFKLKNEIRRLRREIEKAEETKY